MAKTAVDQWDTTAANNTDINSINIQGTAPVSNFDNAFRELMAQIATWRTAANFSLVSTDAGAAAGPDLTLYRNSASPAASDIIGRVLFQGEDSAGNTEDYAEIYSTISDPTSTSEDATTLVRVKSAGAMTTSGTFTGTGFQGVIGATTPAAGTFTTLTTTGAFTSVGIDDNASAERLQIENTILHIGSATAASGYQFARPIEDGTLTIAGGADVGNTSRIVLIGKSHATDASDIILQNPSGTNIWQYDHSAVQFLVGADSYFNNAVRFIQNSTNSPGAGNNTVGLGIGTGGALSFSTSGAHTMNKTADGTSLVIASGGTSQGSIATAGATVSFNAFFGSHWAQTADGSKPDILRGTICESIDQMSSWPDTGTDERLPCFKVSDTPGAEAVYGVFAWWDDLEADITNDALIGGLGAFVVRIAAGQVVQRGDYIESNGDGCGRVQADDILRASTVAKVTSTAIAETYPDGSYLVPCTLHCG